MQVKKKFDWCLRHGKDNYKHRGLRKIEPNEEDIKAHIEKALHNLKVMEYNIKGKYTDWAASAAFYAMYHAILALLSKLGYESRNQECSITALEYFIENKKVNLSLKYVDMIRSIRPAEDKDTAKEIREEMQYGTETKLAKERLEKLRSDAKNFVQRMREVIEEVK